MKKMSCIICEMNSPLNPYSYMALRILTFIALIAVTFAPLPAASIHHPTPDSAVVEEASLNLIAPNGGEILIRGSRTTVTWSSRHIMDGKIILVLYSKGVKTAVISKGCPNTGRFEWKIPENLAADVNYRVRIRWSRQPEVNDFSDADFTIRDGAN